LHHLKADNPSSLSGRTANDDDRRISVLLLDAEQAFRLGAHGSEHAPPPMAGEEITITRIKAPNPHTSRPVTEFVPHKCADTCEREFGAKVESAFHP
jgi:hypothetical protein